MKKKLTNEIILEEGDEIVNSIAYMYREISLTQCCEMGRLERENRHCLPKDMLYST